MADLMTRILLNDKQFSDRLDKSKKGLKDFEEQVKRSGGSASGLEDKLGKLVGGGLTKLIGGFGLATAAGAAFKGIIDNSQTTADGFANAVGAAKASVDQLFKAVATGDFSNFINGLDDVYNRAKNAQAALDQLWNTQNAYGLGVSKTQYQITTARADAYDRELSPEERRKAINDWQTSIDEMRGYSAALQNDLLTAAKDITASYSTLKPGFISVEDLTNTILLDVQGADREELKKKAKTNYGEYLKAVKQAEKDATKTTYEYTGVSNAYGKQSKSRVTRVDQSEFQPALDKLNAQYKSAILVNALLEKMKDTELGELTNLVKEYQETGQQVERLTMDINKAKPRLEKQIASQLKSGEEGSPKVEVDIVPTGSIAELEKQISAARKNFLDATTDEARRSADELIKVLEAKKAFIEIGFKYPGGVGNIEPVDKFAEVSGKIDVPHVDMSGVIQVPKEAKSYTAYLNDVADKNRDLMETVYGVSDALYGMGDVLGGNAGQWLQWGANVVSTVGRSIPALMGLANANASVAASGGAAAVAGIPIVGPVLAAGAVLSIMGALMNLPKFATGGIVGGSSFSGDNVLARVNSGELILNKAQQSNLAGALTGGNGKVRFEIEGSRLVGILEQEARKRSRR